MTTEAYYLTPNATGTAFTGSGYTPDGTIPVGAVPCTQAQAQAYQSYVPDGSGAMADAPATQLLAQAQAKQNALNRESYLAAIQGPVSYTSKGGITTQYQADPGSVANLQDTILGFQLAQATPSGFYWVALDNTQVPFEYTDLLGLAQAMALPGAAAFAKWQSLKAQVAAADLSTVASIVW